MAQAFRVGVTRGDVEAVAKTVSAVQKPRGAGNASRSRTGWPSGADRAFCGHGRWRPTVAATISGRSGEPGELLSAVATLSRHLYPRPPALLSGQIRPASVCGRRYVSYFGVQMGHLPGRVVKGADVARSFCAGSRSSRCSLDGRPPRARRTVSEAGFYVLRVSIRTPGQSRASERHKPWLYKWAN